MQGYITEFAADKTLWCSVNWMRDVSIWFRPKISSNIHFLAPICHLLNFGIQDSDFESDDLSDETIAVRIKKQKVH